MINTTINMKEKLFNIAKKYIGMTPSDMGCNNWGDMERKLEKEMNNASNDIQTTKEEIFTRKVKEFSKNKHGITYNEKIKELCLEAMEEYSNQVNVVEITRINKYGKHQHSRGWLRLDLIKFIEWEDKPK